MTEVPTLPGMPQPPDRTCTKCGWTGPATIVNFGVATKTRTGLHSWCRACLRRLSADHAKKLRQENPEAVRAKRRGKIRSERAGHLLRMYGLDAETYANMLSAQRARCARPGCGAPLIEANVDHCHATGKVRGILCFGCNSGIGHLADNLFGVIGAVAYLAKHEFGGTVDDWLPKIEAILRGLCDD